MRYGDVENAAQHPCQNVRFDPHPKFLRRLVVGILRCTGTVLHDRCVVIREGGLELHKLLKDTNRKLKVSAGLPDWKNYVDFFNSLVRVLSLPRCTIQR